MAGEPPITLVGNITADPEQRGDVASFTIAHNTRRRDRNGQSMDGDSIFMRCAAFGDLANNILQTCHKGMRVVATGYVKTNSWTDKNTGQQRSSLEMIVTDLGLSLRFGVAQFQKTSGQQSNGNGYQQNNYGGGYPLPNNGYQQGAYNNYQQQGTANRPSHSRRHRHNLQHPHSPRWIRGLRPRQPVPTRTVTAPTRNSKRFRH